MADAEGGRDKRPSPDALLELAGQEGRAKLKIFLGAAPGVGKTYAMLSAARHAKADRIDVVVGLVETHGRAETQALLDGLDILPRRPVSYRGQILNEFDLDAARARKPGLILVDEFAHTNVPGSRHPKRYQDVEELLDAGIEVWTTLNVQHLESLSDVVSRITGITVRETVPDTLLERADEVVVVDITPGELLQRLREGKIYVPDNARRAVDNYFKPGNLTALRELALRRTAARVDDQMVAYLRQHAIEGPWPTAERLLVCVGPDALSEIVVRSASRLASALNATWLAVHIERAGHETSLPESLKHVDDTLALARRLGAETMRLTARDLPAEILRLAARQNITQIVIGRSRQGLVGRLLGRSLPEVLIGRAQSLAVHIISGEEAPPARLRLRLPPLPVLAIAVATVFGSVGLAVILGQALSHLVSLPNIGMIFITAVLVSALGFGLWTAIAAAVLSFLAFNFFFIPPLYTFSVAEPHELFALMMFLLVAVLTGTLAGRLRDRTAAVRQRVQTTQSLFDFSRKLSGLAKLDDVLWAFAAQVASAAGGRAIILFPADEDLTVRGAYPPEDTLDAGEAAAARWAFQHGEAAGWHTATLPTIALQFRPLIGSAGCLGAIGLQPRRPSETMTSEDERLISALIEQGSVAIERAMLVEEIAGNRAVVEGEKLRTALLSSISHDLRTPLSAIIGAASTLRTMDSDLPLTAKVDLLATVQDEAKRLDRFVANLLAMTQLEAGALEPQRDWIDLADVVRSAVARVTDIHGSRRVDVTMQDGLPLVRLDPVLFEQALVNLLDNAAKYSPPDTAISIAVSMGANKALITVTDTGKGIASQDLARVFDKFYRARQGDAQPAGTGLGLAIVKGLIEALGGTVRAESPATASRGTRMVMGFDAIETAPRGSVGENPGRTAA